jgi:hypothetical protein
MNNLLAEFSLLGVCALAVAIVVLSALVRKTLELIWPWLSKVEVVSKQQRVAEYHNQVARFYNELGLYVLPYVIGSLIAIGKITFVFGSIETYAGRWIFSMLVATFSALFYKSIKKAIPGLLGVQVETSDKILELPKKE